jgi:hypothetical protein
MSLAHNKSLELTPEVVLFFVQISLLGFASRW